MGIKAEIGVIVKRGRQFRNKRDKMINDYKKKYILNTRRRRN